MLKVPNKVEATSDSAGEGKPVQITVARRSGMGPGFVYVAYVFVFLGIIILCRVYKLTLSDQATVTLHLTLFPI